ncbi:hypothetical protein [Natrarchaeobius chitinivorans]|nr:hypothetical protein [Natrarchaeobius chitinivorans]
MAREQNLAPGYHEVEIKKIDEFEEIKQKPVSEFEEGDYIFAGEEPADEERIGDHLHYEDLDYLIRIIGIAQSIGEGVGYKVIRTRPTGRPMVASETRQFAVCAEYLEEQIETGELTEVTVSIEEK